MPDRRQFFRCGAAAAGGATGLSWLPKLSAAEVELPNNAVQFRSEIEPLVRLLETSPREQLMDRVLAKIRQGTHYQELLAALFLAGIRNVQPRPSVGFKFHSVLVVHSAHQAAIAASNEHRWTPLLWSIDYFKRAQQSDVKEGDWTMAQPPTEKLPDPPQALKALDVAMSKWDIEAADAAATVVARTATGGQILNLLAKHAARDYRSIGHKSIYLANAYRTLNVIGWQHCEPVVRSLCYAILNHNGEPNPATSDLAADRDGRANWNLADQLGKHWYSTKSKPVETRVVAESLRTATPGQAAKLVVELIQSGTHPDNIYDGIMLASAELVSQQPGIVPLHAVTTSNAIRYLYRQVQDNRVRQWLLLQNAAFVPHFRESAKGRGKLGSSDLLELQAAEESNADLERLFKQIGSDRQAAAQTVLSVAQTSEAAHQLIGRAREMVFLKGNDAHDYKFSSAALEDYYQIDPAWRTRYLAGCCYLLHGDSEPTTGLAKRVLQEL